MQIQTIDTTSGRIACRHSAGSGPTIVILHGNSASSRAFTPQIESALGDKYRILVPDLPGHGDSDDAADPAGTYNLPGYAAVLHEIVARLDAADAVFVGWSLGGHILLEAAPELAQARGFAIFGTPPISFPPAMDQAFLPTPAMAYTFQPDLNEEQARAYVAAAFRPGVTDLPAEMVADVLRTDGRARGQLATSIRPGGFRDEVAVAANLKQPLAVLHGAEEQLVNGAYFDTLTMPTLWRGSVQVIDDAGHLPQWEQAERFNALLDQFVAEVAA